MQLSFKRARTSRVRSNRACRAKTLLELEPGDSAVLDRLDVPQDVATRLMELGFVPGHVVVPGMSAPGGDPRVFRVDGSEIALRREMAARLLVRANSEP